MNVKDVDIPVWKWGLLNVVYWPSLCCGQLLLLGIESLTFKQYGYTLYGWLLTVKFQPGSSKTDNGLIQAQKMASVFCKFSSLGLDATQIHCQVQRFSDIKFTESIY